MRAPYVLRPTSYLLPATCYLLLRAPHRLGQEPYLLRTGRVRDVHRAHRLVEGDRAGGVDEDDALFGGPLASTLEELKAQSSALYLTNWLAGKGMFTDEEVRKIQLRNIAWAFGHISRGMYAPDETPRNYSQLAAIQLGSLMQAGAVSWHADQPAANGKDQGCIEINFDALPKAIESLETTVLQIKASGNKKRAEELKAQFVDADDDFAKTKTAITERWLRAPKASFVYAVRK